MTERPRIRIRIRVDDAETQAVWDTAQRAAAEVASWPAWKRGEVVERTAAEERAAIVAEIRRRISELGRSHLAAMDAHEFDYAYYLDGSIGALAALSADVQADRHLRTEGT